MLEFLRGATPLAGEKKKIKIINYWPIFWQQRAGNASYPAVKQIKPMAHMTPVLWFILHSWLWTSLSFVFLSVKSNGAGTWNQTCSLPFLHGLPVLAHCPGTETLNLTIPLSYLMFACPTKSKLSGRRTASWLCCLDWQQHVVWTEPEHDKWLALGHQESALPPDPTRISNANRNINISMMAHKDRLLRILLVCKH